MPLSLTFVTDSSSNHGSQAQRKGIDEARPEALNKITESAKIAELEHSLEQSRAMLAESRQATELSRLDSEMQLRILKEQKDRDLAALNKKLAESEAHRAVVNAETGCPLLKKGKTDAEKNSPAAKSVMIQR